MLTRKNPSEFYIAPPLDWSPDWAPQKKENPLKVIDFQGIWNVVAVRTGLEPVTPCVTGMYSNQLN